MDVNVQVDVEIEVPRGSVVKRRADGSVDFVSPVPCPYNYGFVVDTVGGDGDPIDALVLGRRLARGHRAHQVARAAVRFIDAGQIDDKLICSGRPLRRSERLTVMAFFRFYAVAKGALNRLRGSDGATEVRGWVTVGDAIGVHPEPVAPGQQAGATR